MSKRDETEKQVEALLTEATYTGVMLRVAMNLGEPEAVVTPLVDRFWDELRDGFAGLSDPDAHLVAIELLIRDRIAVGTTQMLAALQDLRQGA